MRVVFKRNISNWRHIPKQEKEGIIKHIESQIKYYIYCIGAMLLVGAGVISRLITKGLGEISAKNEKWIEPLLFLILYSCVIFIYTTMILNPRIENVMKRK